MPESTRDDDESGGPFAAILRRAGAGRKPPRHVLAGGSDRSAAQKKARAHEIDRGKRAAKRAAARNRREEEERREKAKRAKKRREPDEEPDEEPEPEPLARTYTISSKRDIERAKMKREISQKRKPSSVFDPDEPFVFPAYPLLPPSEASLTEPVIFDEDRKKGPGSDDRDDEDERDQRALYRKLKQRYDGDDEEDEEEDEEDDEEEDEDPPKSRKSKGNVGGGASGGAMDMLLPLMMMRGGGMMGSPVDTRDVQQLIKQNEKDKKDAEDAIDKMKGLMEKLKKLKVLIKKEREKKCECEKSKPSPSKKDNTLVSKKIEKKTSEIEDSIREIDVVEALSKCRKTLKKYKAFLVKLNNYSAYLQRFTIKIQKRLKYNILKSKRVCKRSPRTSKKVTKKRKPRKLKKK